MLDSAAIALSRRGGVCTVATTVGKVKLVRSATKFADGLQEMSATHSAITIKTMQHSEAAMAKRANSLHTLKVNASGDEHATAASIHNAAKSHKHWGKLKASFSVRTFVQRQLQELQVLHGVTEEEFEAGLGTDPEGSWVVGRDGVRRRRRCLYNPNGRFRQCWDLAQVVFLLYVIWLVPLRTAFDITLTPGEFGWWIELIVDVFFLLDVCESQSMQKM